MYFLFKRSLYCWKRNNQSYANLGCSLLVQISTRTEKTAARNRCCCRQQSSSRSFRQTKVNNLNNWFTCRYFSKKLTLNFEFRFAFSFFIWFAKNKFIVSSLPYTESTILEVLRMSSLAPIGVFHRAMTDVKFHGYDIPKGTWICPNQYYLHYSEEHWETPKEFNPARFISDDGKTVKRPEAFMPFSYGKNSSLNKNT